MTSPRAARRAVRSYSPHLLYMAAAKMDAGGMPNLKFTGLTHNLSQL
jgi:hypothetical protein